MSATSIGLPALLLLSVLGGDPASNLVANTFLGMKFMLLTGLGFQ